MPIHTILEPTAAPRDAVKFGLTELIIIKRWSARIENASG